MCMELTSMHGALCAECRGLACSAMSSAHEQHPGNSDSLIVTPMQRVVNILCCLAQAHVKAPCCPCTYVMRLSACRWWHDGLPEAKSSSRCCRWNPWQPGWQQGTGRHAAHDCAPGQRAAGRANRHAGRCCATALSAPGTPCTQLHTCRVSSRRWLTC